MQEIANSGRAEMIDYLQIDNQRIAYTITGSPANPPIIFVHGLMSHRVTPKAWASVNATDLTPHLSNITSPTIIIFGKQDGTVPVEQAYLFKERCSTAQLVVFDNRGHFPMYEKFNEYIAPLESFLKEP